MAYYDMVLQAAEYLRRCMPAVPRVGLVLGSGLGGLVDAMQETLCSVVWAAHPWWLCRGAFIFTRAFPCAR